MSGLIRSIFLSSLIKTRPKVNRFYSSLSSQRTLKLSSFREKPLLVRVIFESLRRQSEISKNVLLDKDSTIDDRIQSNEENVHRERGHFDKFRLSPFRQERLKSRSIEYLFPVQYRSFDDIFQGKDCIVQAYTGTGKTLAFTLPVLERLENESKEKQRLSFGRHPRCLVLEPTRELAKQITTDFLSIKNRRTAITTLYGGKQYSFQEDALRRGSDIVVGTPGRIKDFLNQKKLSLGQCEIVVLDEVDRMLDMGFQDDVDFIIKSISNGENKSQMIVFSATIPSWLKKSVSRYMSEENFSFINLIDRSQKKTAINIEHFSVKINESVRLDRLILALFEEHATKLEQSQMIIFCQTKAECDRLIQSNQINSYPSAVLHGDLSQNRREQVLKNFRQGSIRFLITTDISARGLDIPQVDLIVLTSPPQDWESYVHRSGRTGRAGRKGKSICIFNHQQFKQLKLVQTKTNIDFKPIDYKSLRGFSITS